MAVDTTVPRSRRALLAAALGAAAATAAHALGRPAQVRANDPNDVLLGGNNVTGATTSFNNMFTDLDMITINTIGQGYGVLATSNNGTGLEGRSNHPNFYGVVGNNIGDSGGGGVFGSTAATFGETSGVAGQVVSPEGFGVLADTLATGATARALVAHAPAGTGVVGWAGTGPHPAGRPGTGVYGYSAAGTGGQFTSSTGNALRVSGKARFNRAGRVNVPKNRKYVDVTVPGGLASNTIVNATIQMYRSGVAVSGVRHNYPTAGKIRIYLTKVPSTTSSTPVAWFAAEYGS
jgi:hypothetical protein